MKSKFDVPHVVLKDGEVIFEGSNFNRCWFYINDKNPRITVSQAMMYYGYKIEKKEAWHK